MLRLSRWRGPAKIRLAQARSRSVIRPPLECLSAAGEGISVALRDGRGYLGPLEYESATESQEEASAPPLLEQPSLSSRFVSCSRGAGRAGLGYDR